MVICKRSSTGINFLFFEVACIILIFVARIYCKGGYTMENTLKINIKLTNNHNIQDLNKIQDLILKLTKMGARHQDKASEMLITGEKLKNVHKNNII